MIFAYGQTGSGKTFSMMGVLGTDLKGIIPRYDFSLCLLSDLASYDPRNLCVAPSFSIFYR